MGIIKRIGNWKRDGHIIVAAMENPENDTENLTTLADDLKLTVFKDTEITTAAIYRQLKKYKENPEAYKTKCGLIPKKESAKAEPEPTGDNAELLAAYTLLKLKYDAIMSAALDTPTELRINNPDKLFLNMGAIDRALRYCEPDRYIAKVNELGGTCFFTKMEAKKK